MLAELKAWHEERKPLQSFLEMQLMLQGMNIEYESAEKVEELAMR